MPFSDVYIVGAVRSPIGRGYKNGMLHDVLAKDLLAMTLDELTTRTGVEKSEVQDIICGCVSPVGEQGANVGRIASLQAGFPNFVPSVQLNRMCGSSQQAIHFASQAIASGDMDCVIACGVESMSRVPMGSDWLFADPNKEGQQELIAKYMKDFPFHLYNQGESAEMIAEKWNLSREDLDKFSGLSHERCAKSTQEGVFKREIMPITITTPDGKKKVLDKDEGIRFPVDYAKMSKLPTPFKQNGRVSAANASQISDGAAAIMLMSGHKVKALGLKPRARIVAREVVGSDPEMMLTGPIAATRRVLEKAQMKIHQIDCVEINEAFAPVVLSWQKEIGAPWEKINPAGGAIAHGHPLGATGCILMTKLVHYLERTGGRYGLQTMCIGHGMATATIIENLSSLSML